MQNQTKTNTRLAFIQFIFSTFFSNKEVIDETEDFQNYFYKLSVPSLDKDKETILNFNKNYFNKLSLVYDEFIKKNDVNNLIDPLIKFDRKYKNWNTINKSIILAIFSEIQITKKEKIKIILNDYINISKSLSILDANVKDIHKKDEIEKKNIIQAIKYLGKIIGVFSNGIAATLKKEEKLFNEEEINLLIKKRNEARKNKDFDLADNIRKELTDMGIEIKDQSNETVWKKV